jgi:serine/threonine-protein kinase RsbW
MLCPGTAGNSLAPRPDQAAFRLPAADDSVCEARRRVRTALYAWGAGPRCDDMTLVVSELFTNAVRYSGGAWIEVVLRRDAGLLYVEVTDEGRTAGDVTVREAGLDDERGRGLVLVEHLSLSWGAGRSPHGAGHTVWAALRGPGRVAD